MELLQLLGSYFAVLINAIALAFPILFGGYSFIFARRLNLDMLHYRKRVWRTGYSDFEVRFGEIFVRAIGAGVLIFGLIAAAQTLIGRQ